MGLFWKEKKSVLYPRKYGTSIVNKMLNFRSTVHKNTTFFTKNVSHAFAVIFFSAKRISILDFMCNTRLIKKEEKLPFSHV